MVTSTLREQEQTGGKEGGGREEGERIRGGGTEGSLIGYKKILGCSWIMNSMMWPDCTMLTGGGGEYKGW